VRAMWPRSPAGWALGGVGAALVVCAGWWLRAPRPETPATATVSIRITRHDALGMPGKPAIVRDPARVRALVAALDVDRQPPIPCPPDYAAAEVGIVLSGQDVYA